MKAITKLKVKISDFFKCPANYLPDPKDVELVNEIFSGMDRLIIGEVSSAKVDKGRKCWTGNIQISLNERYIIEVLQTHQILCLEYFEFVL